MSLILISVKTCYNIFYIKKQNKTKQLPLFLLLLPLFHQGLSRIILLKSKPDYISLLLNTFQCHLILIRVKSPPYWSWLFATPLTSSHTISPFPATLQLQWYLCRLLLNMSNRCSPQYFHSQCPLPEMFFSWIFTWFHPSLTTGL